MDTNCKASDTSWSPARLRDHECLTLATDLALLKCMQNLSTRISSQSKCLVSELDSLERDTVSAVVQVENAIQNLNLIATKQFVEKRVYDEEERITKQATQPSQVTQSNVSDIVPKIKEGILFGLPAIKSQFSILQNGLDVLANQTAGKDSSYLQRSLPFIVGSVDFISSKTVGIREFYTEPKLKVQESTIEDQLPSDSNEEPLPMPRELTSHGIPNEQVPSDVESLASDVSSSISKSETKETDTITKGFVDVRSELEARLRLPNLGEPASGIANEETRQAPSEDHLPRSLSINRELNQRVQSNAPPALIFEPPPIPKTKGLFDDSSSESDDGSLFGRRRNIEQNSSKNSSITSVSSANKIDHRSDGVLPSPVQSNLAFAASSAKVSPNYASQTSSATTKTEQPTFSASKDNAIHQISSKIPETKKRVNLFFASDSEDDLFEPTFKPQQPNQSHSKPNGVSSVANQTTFPASGNNPPTETSSQVVSDSPTVKHRRDERPQTRNGMTSQNIRANPVSSRERGLFSDSESDGDLFGTKSKPRPQSNIALPVKSDSPPTLPNNLKGISVSKDDGHLENRHAKVQQNHVSAESARLPSNQKTGTLFSDDEEDDLFANVTLPKSQPAAAKLLVPTPKLSNELHHPAPQGNHAVNNNKPHSAADVSASGTRDVTNASVDKKSASPAPFKIPPPRKSVFYSDDDSDDEDLFKTPKEPIANLGKNIIKTADKNDDSSYETTDHDAGKKVIESQNAAQVRDSTSVEEAPQHVISENVNAGEPLNSVPKPPDSITKIDNCKQNAPVTSTPLFDDSDDDIFKSGSTAKGSISSSVKDAVRHPSEKLPVSSEPAVKANLTATTARKQEDNSIRAPKSSLSHSLFDDSDDENLFGTTAKASQLSDNSVLNKNSIAKRAESSNNEAPQMSQKENFEKKLSETTHSLEFQRKDASPFTSQPPPLVAPDVNAENSLVSAGTYPAADRREPSPVPVTPEIRTGTSRALESPPSPVTQRASDETKQPSINSKTPQMMPVSSILESSNDDDDLFSPRTKNRPLLSAPRGSNQTLEAAKSASEASHKDDEENNSQEKSYVYGNEPLATNVLKEERVEGSTVDELSSQKPFEAAETSGEIDVTLMKHDTIKGTEIMKEKPPAIPKKISLLAESTDSEDEGGLFKSFPHNRAGSEEIVAEMPSSNSPESSAREMGFQRSKDDLLTSANAVNAEESPSEKTTSQVDGNNLAKAIAKPVESVRAGKIAALKLSLSQQPNALRFPTPQASSSSDSGGSAINVIRKPFGGVPLFGPPVLPFAKRRSPDSAQSSPTSPEQAVRPFQPKPVHVYPPTDVNESTSGANPDSLLCAGKTRPRLPASRRPPSRSFRRSQIIEYDLEENENALETEEEAVASELRQSDAAKTNVTCPPTESALERPATNAPVKTKVKLFDDSDSSDDELFKPLSSAKKIPENQPRTNLPSTILNQTKSYAETAARTLLKTPLSKNLPPSFLDDDSDDDLFSGSSKSHVGTKKVTPTPTKNIQPSFAANEDPLSRITE